MKRFDCPGCGKPLRFRLLPHVPGGGSGELAFSCIHCGAVLTYNKGPLDTLLWGTSLRRVFTVLGGWALLSGISLAVGKAVTLAAVLSVAHFVSARPAYKVADRGQPGNGAQP